MNPSRLLVLVLVAALVPACSDYNLTQDKGPEGSGADSGDAGRPDLVADPEAVTGEGPVPTSRSRSRWATWGAHP